MVDIDKIVDDEDRTLISWVMFAVKQKYDPLKDFLSDGDIKEALILLGRIGKAIGVKAKRGPE